MTASAPSSHWRRATRQWVGIGSIVFIGWLLTYFPMGLLVAWLSKPMTNRYNESRQRHSDRYIEEGSSGEWEYYATDIPFIRPWDNLEDGQLGEPSGKWSAARKGKERTFWSKYLWAIRNPFNRAKRTSRLLACFVDDCNIVYWGDEFITDKELSGDGEHFVMATDRSTGRVYYGYRKVFHWDNLYWYRKFRNLVSTTPWVSKYAPYLDNKVYNATYGYKIRPSHGKETQDADDKDKAFTFRIQFWSDAG